MHLISSHTDYYDYLVGYYGYDPTIVYDRRNSKDARVPSSKTRELHLYDSIQYLFSICNVYYPVVYKRESKSFVFDEKDERLKSGGSFLNYGNRRFYYNNSDQDFIARNKDKPSKINVETRQPVVLCGQYHNCIPIAVIPRLADYGFASRIDAHEMYQKIYAFLGWLKDNNSEITPQTDKEKIASHGFCPKTSFRPNIKN